MNPFQPMYPPITRTPRLEAARKGIRGPMTEPVLLQGGDYDIFRRDDLKLELHGVEPHSDVVLDLSRTEYLDCSCLGVLVGKLRVWRERKPDTNLRLRNITRNFAGVLRLLELDELFVIESIRSDGSVQGHTTGRVGESLRSGLADGDTR